MSRLSTWAVGSIAMLSASVWAQQQTETQTQTEQWRTGTQEQMRAGEQEWRDESRAEERARREEARTEEEDWRNETRTQDRTEESRERTAEESEAGAWLDDAELTARVKAALIDEDAAPARNIDVETHSGIVQLSGFVESEEARRAAETTATMVSGVQGVQNELVVRETDRTAGEVVDDVVIAAKVKSELAADAGLGTAADVNVEVREGVVQLSGFVDSDEERERAASLARSVDGVQDVLNDISVQPD